MPQPPLKIDVVQFEEASGATLRIGRDASDDSLLFVDALNPSGIKLSELAGLRSVGSVFVVGTSGAGAEYTTLQAAFDAVPVISSSSAPSLILACGDIYNEDLTWEKDGVYLVGLGGAVITSSGPSTIDIKESVGSTPRRAVIKNMKVVNTGVGNSCISITGGSGSTVASERLEVIHCELEPTGTGGKQINATAVNHILVQGGSWENSVSNASTLIDQCASFIMKDVVGAKGIQMDYDNTGAIPFVVGSTYTLSNLTNAGNILSNLIGAGSLVLQGSTGLGNVTVNGDRTLLSVSSKMANLTLNNTTAATLIHSSRGTATGTGTLAESIQTGSISFAASASEVVSFGVAHPDTDYVVSLEYEEPALAITKSKGAIGFTVEFPSGAKTTTVNYAVLRKL